VFLTDLAVRAAPFALLPLLDRRKALFRPYLTLDG
jgi:hypothetical protein